MVPSSHDAALKKQNAVIFNESRINCDIGVLNYHGTRTIFNTSLKQFLIKQFRNVPIWYHPAGKG